MKPIQDFAILSWKVNPSRGLGFKDCLQKNQLTRTIAERGETSLAECEKCLTS